MKTTTILTGLLLTMSLISCGPSAAEIETQRQNRISEKFDSLQAVTKANGQIEIDKINKQIEDNNKERVKILEDIVNNR